MENIFTRTSPPHITDFTYSYNWIALQQDFQESNPLTKCGQGIYMYTNHTTHTYYLHISYTDRTFFIYRNRCTNNLITKNINTNTTVNSKITQFSSLSWYPI